jgi:hypothetical protein
MIISAGLLVLRGFFILKTSVIDDEAYYMMYSRHLAWGYIDHGPMVALIIKLGTILFGENGFGIRVGGLVLYSFMSMFLFHFGKKEFNSKTGVILFTTFWINILFHTNGIVTTPDSPLAFFSLLSVCIYYKAFMENPDCFYLGGLFLGLAFLSKISVLFIAVGIGLFPVICRPFRAHLKDYRFYLSFVIAFAVFSPFILWNTQNDWAFVKYQGGHISGKGGIDSFIELWSGVALLLGPVLFYYTMTLPWRHVKSLIKDYVNVSSKELYFALVTAVPLFYFIIHSLFSRFELNWPAPIFYGGIFLFSIHLGKTGKSHKKKLLFQWGFSLFLILIITVQTFYPVLPLKGKNDITNRYYLYNGLIKNLNVFLKDHPEFNEYRITANNYQIPSMINLCLKPEKEASCLSIKYHKTLYSFLYPLNSLGGERLLFIEKGNSFPSFLSTYWENIRSLASFQSERDGILIQDYSLWELSEFRDKL